MNRLLATLRWRHLRWTAVAAVIPVLWACGARRLAKPNAQPAVIQQKKFAQTVNHKLDILFMIDNSNSMAPLQNKMAMRLPDFMNALIDPATMNLPDLHVAVVSSSLGAGAWGGVPQCDSGHPGSDDGKFQQGPGGAGNGTCAGLNAGEKYLINGDGTAAHPANFAATSNIATIFSCMALLGDTGCGFESQFESVHLALQKASRPSMKDDPVNGDPDNGGFLRSDAFLAVVMFTNEDDCSVAADSLLLDPSHKRVDDTSSNLGGLQSYRCNEFGHTCSMPLPHTAPAAPVTMTGCVSAENTGLTEMPLEVNPTSMQPDPTQGHLTTVAESVAYIQSLKDDPNKILVAAIAGPTTSYRVDSFANMAAGGEPQPEVMHSCTQGGTTPPEYGDPAVRIEQWVKAFDPLSPGVYSICAGSYTASMVAIATAIQKKLGAACIDGNYAMKADGTPDCQVTEKVKDTATGVITPTSIPFCTGGNANAPCWTVQNDPQCTGGNVLFKVCVDAGCMPMNLSTEERNADVSCALM